MITKAPINPQRIRKINGSFSWIEHRFISEGFLAAMSHEEIVLYFFLVLVGDKNGISFYSYQRICQLLQLETASYVRARNQLMLKSLIACENGRFQVLALPEKSSPKPTVPQSQPRSHNFKSLAEVFKNWDESIR